MTPDLKVLVDNRKNLHLAEIGAWLHDMGKCSDEMIKMASWDKNPDFRYNPKSAYVHKVGSNEINLFGKTILLSDLIKQGTPGAVERNKGEEWIVAALGRAHGSAHIEKEEALTREEKQDIEHNINALKKNAEKKREDARRKRELSIKLEKDGKGNPLKLRNEADVSEENAFKLQNESDRLLLRIKSVHQSKDDTRSSSPFGYEKKKISGLTDGLKALPFNQIENRSQIINSIIDLFGHALGDTRRPTNEVTLADWSSLVAALFKSAIVGELLKDESEFNKPTDLRWRFLSVRFNSEIIWGSASSIPILSARKNWLVTGLNNVKNLIEKDYHIGNEVYRDENGSIFVVPDISNLLDIKDSSNGKSLSDMISENLGLEGEVVITPVIDFRRWWGQNPNGRPDPKTDEIPPIAKIISSEPYSPADASIVQSWWKNASGNPEVCTVSSLRPSGLGKGAKKRISDYWAYKIIGRAREWFDHQDTTIWIDEVADVNGRICLMVGRIDISNWLTPEGHIRSLLVKPPDGTNDYKRFTKTPSFARIRRIWETTRAFWMDIKKDMDGSDIVGYAGPRLKIAGNFESATDGDLIQGFNAYEAEVVQNTHPSNGIRLSIFYAGNNSFTVIDNLQRLAIVMDAPSEILNTYKASAEYVKNHLKGKLIIYDQEIISKKIGEFSISNVTAESDPYLTAVPILSEPSIFMAIVPASKAMNVAKHIQEKYDREMGKVKNRLPITLGMVFAKSHMPLAALIDAGTRMLNNRQREEKWLLNEDAKISGSDCIVDFENGITWQIPVMMGDGKTDDVWYPNFYLDGCPTDRTTMFQINKNCLIHAKELKKGDMVKICLSRFDFEFLDSASRRFEVSYDEERGKRRDKIRGQRPYLLDELADFDRLWKLISEELSISQIKETVGLIETKREEWMLEADDPVFENFVHSVIQNANWENGKPTNIIEVEKAALSGKLRDIVELYMDILKLNGPVEKMGGM